MKIRIMLCFVKRVRTTKKNGLNNWKRNWKVEQHKHAEEEEREIVQEILCDINKCFSYDNNPHTNQQLIGHKDLFRVVIAKEQVVSNQKWIYFKSYGKLIVESCVEYHHECLKWRCSVLHNSEAQKSVNVWSVRSNRRYK